MKILLVNGSPHEQRCTYTALLEIAKTLEAENIESEIFWIGVKPIASCIDCHRCANIGVVFSMIELMNFSRLLKIMTGIYSVLRCITPPQPVRLLRSWGEYSLPICIQGKIGFI